jgi:hypothetical protein
MVPNLLCFIWNILLINGNERNVVSGNIVGVSVIV